MLTRRRLLGATAGGVLVAGQGGWRFMTQARAADPTLGPPELPAGTLAESTLEALPGKLPLIKKTYRPPNYETPLAYFKDAITPNQAFFVRYHVASIPPVDAAAWRLRIGGEAAEAPFELTLDQLKHDFEPVAITAVCQCSGNRRGLFEPHVPGVQWGLGAMGNARWKGARLKDVLAKAKLKREAVEIALDGADGALLPQTPDFVKSLPVWKALHEHTLIAYEMNGEPLPHWNGFPARIVAPGWTATYWVKHLTDIQALAKPFDGFWMKTAYRIPKGKFPLVERFVSQESETNTPITEMVVNSLITSIANGQQAPVGAPLRIAGIAWDGGYGIQQVEVSSDDGASWRRAELGEDLGPYAFRIFSYEFTPSQPGPLAVLARASNRVGATQTFALIPNPAGYHHNVVQRVTLEVTA